MSSFQSAGDDPRAAGGALPSADVLPSAGPFRQDYVPALEGIRGMAIVLVVLSHMGPAGEVLDRSINLRGIGNYGVFLFFVLSAFLLTRQFLERPPVPVTSSRYWGAYAVRRLLRIYPLYAIALLVTAIWPLASFAIAGPHPPSILRHLLLLDGQKILWTIPVEMKFYALLPAILVPLHVVTRSRPIPSMIFLLVFLYVATLLLPPDPIPKLSIHLRDYLALFVFGMIAAAGWQVLRSLRTSMPMRWLFDVLAIFLLLAVVAPEVLGAPFGPSHEFFTTWLGSTVSWYGAVWSLFLLSTLAGSFVAGLFENRIIRGIGVASFSGYLWHMPVIVGMRRILPPTTLTAVAIFAAVMIVSVLSYRFLERPGIALSARWSRRRFEAAAS